MARERARWHPGPAGPARRWVLRAAAPAVVVAAVLAAGSSLAAAARPIAGARYVFSGAVGGAAISVELTLANDGRELAAPSTVQLHEPCSATEDLFDRFALDGRSAPASRAVGVGPDGRFSHRVRLSPSSRRELVLVGRFAQRGRVAVGTAHVREDRPCPDADVRFRARFAGRPNARRPGRWSACDPVVTGLFDFPAAGPSGIVNLRLGNTYDIYDRGAGCTTAREIARRFNASVRCLAVTAGTSCAVKGATCTGTRGGGASARASAGCRLTRRASARAELVHFQPCTPPPSGSTVVRAWAVNVDCDTVTSYPVDALLPGAQGDGPCGGLRSGQPFRCSPVAGFRCRGRVTGPGPRLVTMLCADDADPFLALRFSFSLQP
jgi:hypothetical protein